MLFVVVSLYSSFACATTTLTFTTPHNKPISSEKSEGFVDQIVAEALSRIGYKLRVIHLPAERALINANRGIDDGVLHRIAGLNKTYRNLVQAGETTYKMQFVAFSKRTDIRIKRWDSLRPYTVGMITGWKILENNIPGGTEVVQVKNPEQLFSLLKNDRIDIILYGKWQGLNYLNTHDIHGVRMMKPPLAERKMYAYFNKKYKKLVPRFDRALRNMKADGTWLRIYRNTLEPLDR